MEESKHHWEVLRSGQVVVSSSPELLWDNACRYFKWSDDHPIHTLETIKSGKLVGTSVTEKRIRPYSIKALCLHCGIEEEWLRDIRASRNKQDGYYIVVNRILYIIYIQNLEHAQTGVFNPIFTAKVLNLEKEEVPQSSIKVEVITGLPELSDSENQILQKLELENLDREKDQK